MQNNKLFIHTYTKSTFIQHLHICSQAWHSLTTFTIPGEKAGVTLNIISIKSPDNTVSTHPHYRRNMSLNVFSIELYIILNYFEIVFHLVIN